MNEELYLLAGLRPLPLGRMIRQAGRPMTKPASRRILNRFNRPALERGAIPTPKGAAEETIRRIQRMNETVENFDPQDSEWREWMNRNRENKRSRTLTTDIQQLDGPFNEFVADSIRLRDKAYRDITDYEANAADFKAEQQQIADLKRSQRLTDFAMLDGGRYSTLKESLFGNLDSKYDAGVRNVGPEFTLNNITMDSLPASIQYGPGRELGNDMLAEWRSSRSRMLRERELSGKLEMMGDMIRTIGTPSNPSQSLNEIMYPGI